MQQSVKMVVVSYMNSAPPPPAPQPTPFPPAKITMVSLQVLHFDE